MEDELRNKAAQDRAESSFRMRQFAGNELDNIFKGGIVVMNNLRRSDGVKKDTVPHKSGVTKANGEDTKITNSGIKLAGEDSARTGESPDNHNNGGI